MNGLVFRFARWCPGALGLWLRQRLFPPYFKACGRKVLFGRFVEFVSPERICLGNRVVLNNGVVLDAGRALANPAIILEDNVFIGTGTILRAAGQGTVTIRSGANFSSLCRVRASAPLEVGRNCLVAAYCELGDSTPAEALADHDKNKLGTNVEEGCWLGVRMRLLSGVTVGHDTIVGAHAVVAADLPPLVVAVGSPAAVIRKR
jgi:acetyltransferase-like isoleucine patch superfamily enzyme